MHVAGDWMKVEHSTPEKPEILTVAATLKIEPTNEDVVFARWFRLQRWADQHVSADGVAGGMTLERLSAAVATPGLAEAFAGVGWLVETNKGVRFVNWRRHNGKSGKARAQANRRQSVYRASKTSDAKVTQRASRARLPEKRREEKRRDDSNTNTLIDNGVCGEDAADQIVRMRPNARVRMAVAYAAVQPAGVKSGAVARALPEAVRRASAAGEWGEGLGLDKVLDGIADRAEQFAASRLARTTPRQYIPRLARWLDEHSLDDPAAWDVAYAGGGEDAMAEAKRRLEAM